MFDRSVSRSAFADAATSSRGPIIAAVLVVLLAGCQANQPTAGNTEVPSAGSTEIPSAVGTEVVETIAEVYYYYACGNEVLELPDGRRFYPFVRQDEVDKDAYLGAPSVSHRAASVHFAAATLAVPMPEPGDDTGTLTIFQDGTAHFVSETGIEAWLTDEEQTYNWVC